MYQTDRNLYHHSRLYHSWITAGYECITAEYNTAEYNMTEYITFDYEYFTDE